MHTSQEAIVRVTQRISQMWRTAKWDEMRRLFSEDIVQVGPRLKELSRGREVAIESYRQFMTSAHLTDYHEENFRAEVWPGFALCIYDWRMRYTAQGDRRYSAGTDQFVFREVRTAEWVAVWRFLDFWEDKKDE